MAILRLLLVASLVACGSGSDGTPGPDRCASGCVATLAAGCENGPASQEVCEADCRQLQTGRCATAFAALQVCSEGKAVTCNAMGLPTVAACAGEQMALVTCLNSG